MFECGLERETARKGQNVDALWFTTELDDRLRVLKVGSCQTELAEAEGIERRDDAFGVRRVSPTIKKRTSCSTNDRKNSWKSGFSSM